MGRNGTGRLILPDRTGEAALYIAVDLFRLHELPSLWGRPSGEIFAGRSHGDAYRRRFAGAIEAGRMEVLAPASVVVVDADHEYESVRRDLASARRAVADDGWIILNETSRFPASTKTRCTA
jgi:hypothetical protein